MASTAFLDLYILRALEDPTAHIFSPSAHMNPPKLSKKRINHILTFRGCFNPPHQGHKDTLCHGFFRGGKDIRLIAAIILPLSDDSVAAKYSRGSSGRKDLVLTLQERISLINNSGLHGGWHWCHPHGAKGSESFKRRLISEAAEDGFAIYFITLTGPDHVSEHYGYAGYHGPTIVVGTGDFERTSLRTEAETGLRKLALYQDWYREALAEKFIQELGAGDELTWPEQKLLMLFPLAMADLPRDYDERLQKVKDRLCTNIWRLGKTRLCHHSTGPIHEWVRYVPTHFFGMTGGAWFVGCKEEPLSSSRLRNVLANSHDADELTKTVSGIALSPQLSLQYVEAHKQRALPTVERKRGRVEEEDTEANRLEREGIVRNVKRLKKRLWRLTRLTWPSRGLHGEVERRRLSVIGSD